MILIDTTPLVALCDARDSHHQAALADMQTVASERLGVCEAVLMETCFHLSADAQRRRLRALLDRLHIASVPGTTDRGFWLEVFDWLSKYADHEPDWADGCLAVLSGRDTNVKVWTYDREFRTTWKRPDGTAIPMAVRRRGARHARR